MSNSREIFKVVDNGDGNGATEMQVGDDVNYSELVTGLMDTVYEVCFLIGVQSELLSSYEAIKDDLIKGFALSVQTGFEDGEKNIDNLGVN